MADASICVDSLYRSGRPLREDERKGQLWAENVDPRYKVVGHGAAGKSPGVPKLCLKTV